jgi:hypothetical protein
MDLDPALLRQIEAFFVDYNHLRGRRFEAIGRKGLARPSAWSR